MSTRQYYITGDDGYQKVYGTHYEAQTFTVSITHRIMACLLKIGENSATNYQLEVAIQGVDVNGKPDGTDLVSYTVPSGEVVMKGSGTTTGAWIEISFGEGYVLAAGTVYAVVLRIKDDAGNATTEYWAWRDDGSSPTYTDGSRFYSDDSGSTWTTDTTSDFMFAERDGRRLHDSCDGALSAGSDFDDDSWLSETFTPSEDFTIYSIAVPLYKSNGDINAVTLEIYAADVDHKPTGSVLATGTLSAASANALGTSSAASVWSEISLSSPLNVTNGTEYCVVLYAASVDSGETGKWTGQGNYRADLYFAYSNNSGASWTVSSTGDRFYRIYGANFQAPLSDQKVVTRIVEAVGNEIWYGVDEALQILPDSIDEIDCSIPIHMFELKGKCYIANGANLKVIDFANVKLTTANIGSHPPDFETVLSGETSGAQLVVDYIDALAGAVTIYGKLITTAEFTATETVTGTDDDGNAISFTLAAFTSQSDNGHPFFYDWTVYGNSSTYGEMPSYATLGNSWRGRACLSGDKNYPQFWYDSRQGNPYDWNYISLDSQSPVASDNADAGQTGEPILAQIPYSKDFFIYGCTNSIWYLAGDPADGGSLLTLDNSAGFLSADGWCWDKLGDLYIVATTGILRIPKGFGTPENITAESYPDFVKDLAYDSTLHKLCCGYDRLKHGFKVCKTILATGANENWWFDIQKKGLFPDSYPEECGVFCLYWYEALNPNYRVLLHGCNDGYIRYEDPAALSDDIGDIDEAIDSYVTFGPIQLSKDSREGIISDVTAILSGSRTGTLATDSSTATLKLWTELDADSIMERFNLNTSPKLATTVKAPGRSRGQTIRRPVRGVYAGLRIGNNTLDEGWGLEKIIINGRDAGGI